MRHAAPGRLRVSPLACAGRLWYPASWRGVIHPQRSSPAKFCTFSRVICAQIVKRDLCWRICRKNCADGMTAFARFAPLALPFPCVRRSALTSSCRACPHQSRLLLPSLLSYLLWQGGWTRWPTDVPSNPYHSVILWFTCFALLSLSYSLLSAKPMHSVYKDLQLKLVADICCSWGVFFSKLSDFHLVWSYFSDGTPVLSSEWYLNLCAPPSKMLQIRFLYCFDHNVCYFKMKL